jgi:hypothetical protein
MMLRASGFSWRALILAVSLAGPQALALDHHDVGPGQVGKMGKWPKHRDLCYGTTSYGGPRLYQGFQGFGLRFHPGYGYGGYGLGTGAEGGYPAYGGPGYPHCPPPLNRFGRILPFHYWGGPGFPTPAQPNFYAPVGPLFVDPPVVTQGDDLGYPGVRGDFGCFTGALPYPETAFAPYVTAAGTTGAATSVTPSVPEGTGFGQPSATATPPASETAVAPTPVPQLGFDEEPVVDVDGLRGMKVSRLVPGSLADKAGLKADDVVRSINAFPTTRAGNIAWIIASAAPDKMLTIVVRVAADGKEHTITIRLP